MRIGIDARLYRASVAGIGRYSQNLIKNILNIDRENEYVFLMTKEDRTEFDQLKTQNSKLKIIETDIKHYSLAEQMKLPKILEQEKCDFWHFLNFNVPVRFKGKFIVTIHDLTLFFYPGRTKNNFFYKLAYKYIMGQACRNAQKIIAVSEATKKDIVKMFQTATSKIQVIYEAADDKQFGETNQDIINKLKQQYAIGHQPVLLYVGQWRPHKNLLGLIQAFNLLRCQIPVKLAILGKVDTAYPEIIHAIDKSPYVRDIIKPGFTWGEKLSAWYQIACILVFPSFYEGFGLPGLEAMMAGLPVAASDRTSLPEIYGDAAVYFNPDDIDDMKNKISSILEQKSLRNELIQKGFQKVKEYSWQKTAEETLKIYREILKN